MALLPWLVAALVAGWVCARAARRAREADRRAQQAEQQARLSLARAERDHRRLAAVLHDGPVQDLLALGMDARVSTHLGLPVAPPDVSGVVQQLRAVSEGLRPPALGPFGLAAALTAHVERFRANHPAIAVSLDLDDDDLPAETRLALFRIAQEAIGNAALHGPPLTIDIRLSTFTERVEFTIRDDGNGWEVPDDIATLAQTGRYGVFGMLMQAESVGASLTVQSAPGETVVHISALPTRPNQA
ncbi:sensor histidine kinase [Rubrivirga sp. SAORIC476]|uniref:sensor histidine kinase n=1 Tax=Rubrivirga sp. SAORIC476 TaxID=1961794 RepID=UPI0011799179|nr:ATP-binding protein [Rubrivirga sp. SAORIC476]